LVELSRSEVVGLSDVVFFVLVILPCQSHHLPQFVSARKPPKIFTSGRCHFPSIRIQQTPHVGTIGLDIIHIFSFLEELEYKELPDKLDNT
jgi:hypothetical protein